MHLSLSSSSHPFALPMTYSIAGYRAVISSGDYAYMWEQAAVLGGVAIVMMALTLIYFKVLLKKEN
ncbi:hypothetical protein [Bacillus sp. H15-1]|uniref:hypothetical protein n=1 Tax=Bacillus sp. H15-1 TaxID=1856406 RepID=UPI001E582EA2|nr:hypothetical protein [Bacillus sp. H15-1]